MRVRMDEGLSLRNFRVDNGFETAVEVGGVTCLIVSQDRYFTDLIREEYSGFISEEKPEFVIEVKRVGKTLEELGEVRLKEMPVILETCNGTMMLDIIREEPLSISFRGGRVFLDRYDVRGYLLPEKCYGRVVFNYSSLKTAYGIRNRPRPFRDFLRACYSFILLDRKGFLLHSSAVNAGGMGLVFSGPTNAGKSTIASLSGFSLLNEEMNVIRRIDGGVYVFSTPFGGEEKSVRTRLPLEKVFFIKKSDKNSLHPMDAFESLTNTMSNELITMSVSYRGRPSLVRRVFNNVFEVMEGVECHRLFFKNDSGVREMLSGGIKVVKDGV
jgi:hypothetical protein